MAPHLGHLPFLPVHPSGRRIRLWQLLQTINIPEGPWPQRLGAVLRHTADGGHDDAARFLLELQCVRVALVNHGLGALEELD